MTKTSLVSVFNALGDNTRFKLMQLLQTHQQICVSELAKEIGISNAGVSQQLHILERAGLIQRNRIGQKICYTVQAQNQTQQQVLSLLKNS